MNNETVEYLDIQIVARDMTFSHIASHKTVKDYGLLLPVGWQWGATGHRFAQIGKQEACNYAEPNQGWVPTSHPGKRFYARFYTEVDGVRADARVWHHKNELFTHTASAGEWLETDADGFHANNIVRLPDISKYASEHPEG